MAHPALPLILAFLAAFFVAAPPTEARTAATDVQIGTARARPGEAARGVLPVPAGVDPGYDIPLFVLNGRRPGPRIALVAGLHGAEFASVIALQRLAAELDPQRLSGTVVIVPLVNIAGFEQNAARVNPVDGKNMNRHFPGSPDGTQTERASHLLTRELLATSDYVIDYHGGDIDEDQEPYAYWIVARNADLTAKMRKMVRAFGLRYVIRFPFDETVPGKANLLPTQAVALGKPTITVDAGRAGAYTQADLDTLVDGTKRVLAELGMIEVGKPGGQTEQEIVRAATLNSPATGIFYPSVRRGERVPKGALLGIVTDHHGRRLAEITAPDDAVILYLNSTPSAVKDRQLFYIGIPTAEDSP